MEAVPDLLELLESKDRFDVFEQQMDARGWVTDEELRLTRVSLKHMPSETHLARLYNRHGKAFPADSTSLECVAFNQGDEGFLYVVYDTNRYPNVSDLRKDLLHHGYSFKN